MRATCRLLSLAIVALAGCDRTPPPVTLHPADAVPARLSAWHVAHSDGKRLQLNDDVWPYALNTPLFSDYALKLRTVWMPEGTAARYREDREFDFPVGTVLSKTFHYEKAARGFNKIDGEARLGPDGSLDLGAHRLVETRLLVRYADGWKAWPYVWNDAQTEAWLEIAGGQFEFEIDGEPFVYVVPDMNQCGACHVTNHTTKEVRPLGLKAHQLNRDFDYVAGARNQLARWTAGGRLTGTAGAPPGSARWSHRDAENLDDLARAYLDVNCAHCHNPDGTADTSALILSLGADVDRRFGICKPPVAVGRGSGNRPYDIYPGKPELSILLYRMEHDDPAIMMPELGRALAHSEGVSVIREWIAGLAGDC